MCSMDEQILLFYRESKCFRRRHPGILFLYDIKADDILSTQLIGYIKGYTKLPKNTLMSLTCKEKQNCFDITSSCIKVFVCGSHNIM